MRSSSALWFARLAYEEMSECEWLMEIPLPILAVISVFALSLVVYAVRLFIFWVERKVSEG